MNTWGREMKAMGILILALFAFQAQAQNVNEDVESIIEAVTKPSEKPKINLHVRKDPFSRKRKAAVAIFP